MKILNSESAHTGDSRRDMELFKKALVPLINGRLYFRGFNEPGSLRIGYLKEIDGDTITFRDDDTGQFFVYPAWDVMVAVPDEPGASS